VIANSVRAACESDWPLDKLRVIVTDDGRDEALANQIALLQKIYPQLHYTSRPKPAIPDYKAGNLNHAITLSSTFPSGASNLIAGLDADMIVQPHWLRSMVPHLLADSKTAMVCAHQHFYNLPPSDPLLQSLAHFSATTELVHRGLDAADCTGTGYIVRRSALASINGFPTFSIAEDTACSMLLLGQGYSVTYVDEKMQCGLMPDTFVGHVKQRTRWTMGNVQTAFKMNFHIGSARLVGCTWKQRLIGVSTGASSILNAAVGIFGFVGLALALISGFPFVIFDNAWQLRWLVRTVGVWVFLDWGHRSAFAVASRNSHAMRWDQAEAWLVPCEF
jgi:cellulose synthase/poly-beta-1,6-N-acetylglucosamine synthase-like glycosyltransferase